MQDDRRSALNREETLQKVQESRAEWEALTGSVPEGSWDVEAWPGGWNLRDIIAHVDFYEWWAGEFIRKRDWPVVDPLLNTDDMDARNAALYELNKDRSFDEVRNDSACCHGTLVDALTNLTAAEFDNPVMPGMEGPDWTIASIGGPQIWEHYDMHRPDIEAILAASS